MRRSGMQIPPPQPFKENMKKLILIATIVIASLLASCEGCMPGHEMDGRSHNPVSAFSGEDTAK